MIDEKGRLFGKINIVDLIVILVIVIAAVVVGMKFLGGSGSAINPTKTPVRYTVLVEGVEPEVYENIRQYIPGQLMASGEMLDGYVTDVEVVEGRTHAATVDTADGTLEIPVNTGKLDLIFTIECNVVNSITTEIGTQEVRVGKTHTVKTNRFELINGIILDCDWGEDAEAAINADSAE